METWPKGAKHALIKELIKPERHASLDWALEMRVLNALIKKYPEYEFWRKFSLDFKLNSVCWLRGDGKETLYKRYLLFNLDLKQKPALIEGNQKVGEDYVAKPQLSLKDLFT